MVLVVTGTVRARSGRRPAAVYLGPVPAGSEGARTVALRAGNDGVPLRQHRGRVAALRRAHRRRVENGPAMIIDVVPEAPLGPFQTVVRVHTTSRARPVVEVPITGTVTAASPPAAGSAP